MNANRFKYPRTRHLPSSRSRTDDDKIASVDEVTNSLGGKRVIITEKMDGESTTIYDDGYTHARSIDSKFHPSRTIIKELAALVAHDLPAGWRICGENIFAVHSIEYDALSSYFQVISFWNGDQCISWDETCEWATMLELDTVPVLYDGIWVSEAHAHSVWESFKKALPEGQDSEGFVIRNADSFTYDAFGNNVFKYVRKNHVQTDSHWMKNAMKANKLA